MGPVTEAPVERQPSRLVRLARRLPRYRLRPPVIIAIGTLAAILAWVVLGSTAPNVLPLALLFIVAAVTRLILAELSRSSSGARGRRPARDSSQPVGAPPQPQPARASADRSGAPAGPRKRRHRR
ncbi:MAG TPA: hypothetical protein VIV06_05500 [Candidatus Limnocylindrales bacterium]